MVLSSPASSLGGFNAFQRNRCTREYVSSTGICKYITTPISLIFILINIFFNYIIINFILILIKEIDFDFELRTTVNTKLIDENDINCIIHTLVSLGYKNTYYLQNFLETPSNIGDISKSRDINKRLINSKNLIIQYRN